ncbi:MAG: DUF4405 domain-containing protein [Deltaproteobacteria bacterium]|nr:DUF4405 domain-containing protein [Deltaproteobacteria bacterium]
MKKLTGAKVNFIIDTVAFVEFVFLLSTGLLIYYILPPGAGQAQLWGLTRHEWGDIHFVLALLFVVTMGIHLLLHWTWIRALIEGGKGGRKNVRIAIAIIAAVLLLMAAAVPFLGTRQGDISSPDHDRNQGKGKHGRAAFHEKADAPGLADHLSIPRD